jgi:glycosyltransferase involved in cell wall biosynthesis
MKVLFDTQIFDWQINGGISRYFIELFQRLDHSDDIDLLFKCAHSYNTYIRDTKWLVKKPVLKNLHFKGKLRALKAINERINRRYSNRVLRDARTDLFHPTYYEPYFLDLVGKTPFILTVYDLTHEKFFAKGASLDVMLAKKKKLIEAASHIVSISENTKKDVIEYYGIDPAKITTIYLASSFDPGHKKGAVQPIDGDYVLFVGSRSGYKNFAGFAKEIGEVLKKHNIKLVVAGGGELSGAETSLFKTLGIEDRIVFFPHVSDDHLKQLYEKALVFIFPSLYEGFGIPVLEAMQCNCPVLLSNNSSLPEVGGEAADYFDPFTEGSLCDSLDHLIRDEKRRAEMKKQGIVQAAKFNWDNTADRHIEVYKTFHSR